MARLYEYQGKQLLRAIGIKTPTGGLATTGEEAYRIAKEIGKPVVVKAQVWATGRFKAGGIRFANEPGEVEKIAVELLASNIKGLPVRKVLIEERLDIKREFYVGVVINDSFRVRAPILVFSTEGGIDIEETVAKKPESVTTFIVDYLKGVGFQDVQRLIPEAFSNANFTSELVKVICGLYQIFTQYDARAAEINPLILTKDENILAADCRITLDDNAVYRHPEFGIKVPRDMDREPTELEEVAWQIEEGDYRGTGYFTQMVPEIKERGYIGFHGIGGGAAMLGVSALLSRGLKIADYADTSGDPPASKVYRVIRCILAQQIDGYVLLGSVLASQEQWHHAHAIVKALRDELENRPGFPVLLLLAGNKEREAHQIIREGLKDLPIRWELYGRDHIYETDFLADKATKMVKDYLEKKRSDGREN